MKRTIAFVALLAVSACEADPPVDYILACETQTGPQVFQQPPADGVAWALPGSGLSATAFMIETGAAWVEVALGEREVSPAERAPADAVFRDGPGRYVLRPAFLRNPACQSRLQAAGYDPATLSFVDAEGQSEPSGRRRLTGLDGACLSVERVGDLPEGGLAFGEPSRWLSEASAPYALVQESQPVGDYRRDRRLIVVRATGEVIAQETSFRWYAGDFHGEQSCGPHGGPSTSNRPFAARVFTPAD